VRGWLDWLLRRKTGLSSLRRALDRHRAGTGGGSGPDPWGGPPPGEA